MTSRNRKGAGASRQSGRAGPAPVSAELATVIRGIIAGMSRARRPSLAAVRSALQRAGVTWSKEGEVLFPQDRTSLLIEIDELIDQHGARADARRLLGPRELRSAGRR